MENIQDTVQFTWKIYRILYNLHGKYIGYCTVYMENIQDTVQFAWKIYRILYNLHGKYIGYCTIYMENIQDTVQFTWKIYRILYILHGKYKGNCTIYMENIQDNVQCTWQIVRILYHVHILNQLFQNIKNTYLETVLLLLIQFFIQKCHLTNCQFKIGLYKKIFRKCFVFTLNMTLLSYMGIPEV